MTDYDTIHEPVGNPNPLPSTPGRMLVAIEEALDRYGYPPSMTRLQYEEIGDQVYIAPVMHPALPLDVAWVVAYEAGCAACCWPCRLREAESRAHIHCLHDQSKVIPVVEPRRP